MAEESLKVGTVLTFWETATASREYMGNTLAAHDRYDLMPEPPTVLACLKSALGEEFPSKAKEKTAIRPSGSGKGYAVVTDPPKDSERRVGDDWGTVKAIAELSDLEDECSLTLNPYDYELRQRLMEAIRVKRQWLTSGAVGKILAELIQKLDGVAYKKNGDLVYNLPVRNLDQWKPIAKAICLAPAMRGDKEQTEITTLSVLADEEMLRAVEAGITTEITRELESIESDIAQGSLKEEACLNRLAKAGELQRKVMRYEADIGKTLAALNAAVEKTTRAVAWTTLQVSNSAVVRDAMAAHC